jgi:hypothetical protein
MGGTAEGMGGTAEGTHGKMGAAVEILESQYAVT